MHQLFVEKKPPFRVKEAKHKRAIEHALGYEIDDLRLINLYYRAQPFSDAAVTSVFSEPLQDIVYHELTIPPDYLALRVEYLPGQFDQRAYWAGECLALLGEDPTVYSATVFLLKGVLAEDEPKLEAHLINPIESRKRQPGDYSRSLSRQDRDRSFETIEDFFEADPAELIERFDLAMNADDVKVIQSADRSGQISWTELKLLDTYWSDHCRHTTFLTELGEIDLTELNIPVAHEIHRRYLEQRPTLTHQPVSLMDLAVWSMRRFKRRPDSDIELSDEINACSIKRQVAGEPYLIMFKNETHNHPTEIEPYGGAATCLGGAIRDPLSGRAQVYQAMRITGAKDPLATDTLPGKLPQATISKRAAEGFSAYGNQIGLCTGHVREYFHPGFEAKRMELGFVIAATPQSHVTRGNPEPGDRLLLIGGATGRDGIGGAAGSSKEHTEGVLEGSSAEVQKGNAPEERKLIRFFRHPQIGPRIIRCNDLGAGGISVGFGELADGLAIELAEVPLKYQDIYPWEIVLSESQERMALVVSAEDVDLFYDIAHQENLICTDIGQVIAEPVFRITYHERVLVEISRELLNSAGAPRRMKLKSEAVVFEDYPYGVGDDRRSDLLRASQQGLVEQFDASIGGVNLLNPYGGITKKTFVEGMVSLIPAPGNQTEVSLVSVGYDPYIASWSPYHGGEYAVLESLAKNLALGGDIEGLRFTFQEYFERLGDDPTRWAKPYLSLLGANRVLDHFGLPSIGGKDSMSGSYQSAEQELRVPPTLVSFAVNTGQIEHVLSPELKPEPSHLVMFRAYKNQDMSFDLARTEASYRAFREQVLSGNVLAASVITDSLERTLVNMAKGNLVGAKLEMIAADFYNTILAQVKESVGDVIARVAGEEILINDRLIDISQRIEQDDAILQELYPLHEERAIKLEWHRHPLRSNPRPIDEVKVLLPVFPGTNSEDDLSQAFEAAGAKTKQLVFVNQAGSIDQAITELAQAIDRCDVLALSGGFSAADEPDGSAKFIATVFRHQTIKQAFERLIDRGGFVLGICNGFQALVKLGVFENNKIEDPEAVSMSLTYNTIGRHQAKYVTTRLISNASPWLHLGEVGQDYPVPISSGEGRFYADEATLHRLHERSQIITTYLDNPNGSLWGIEGLISPNGQILGKMGHTERAGAALNIYGHQPLGLFDSIVGYLKGEI
ncbi:MAG TPA: phosphoribosylformylglycinamidine synthase [Tissierellia bacterium]|nr:phosphoribosylformylglycinamidine synthase [Tissierellia bacterium]